jgi:hypothetical protein
MIQRSYGPRLAPKAFERAGILDQILGKKLERHPALKSRVLGLVNDAHAPSANAGENSIMRHDFADHLNPLKSVPAPQSV